MDIDKKESREHFNVPASDLPKQPLSKRDLCETCESDGRIPRIAEEFEQGFRFLEKHKKTVTVFGSARTEPDTPYYEQAVRIANRITQELGYGVVTGGGPGIMEAANRGAFDAGGTSIGLNIKLPNEQRENAFLTDTQPFYYFFTRKVMLSFAAEAYLFFPGGFGTMDELFEMLTLIQTGKIEGRMPVILIGTEFWKPLDTFITDTLYKKHHTIHAQDIALYTMTDDEDEVINIIRNAPVRT